MGGIVVLSGGVGGARFLRGLVAVVEPSDVTAVVNVGDDLEILGLHVSPDLDSVLYTLACVADEERGWGRAAETWHALEEAGRAGGETWFQLGDRDIGLHLVRTEALRAGEPLSSVTARLARAFGVHASLLPATDDSLRTWLETADGAVPLQDWFVRRAQQGEIDSVRFEGADAARAAPGVLDAIDGAELILIAPSNPYISVWPILAVQEIRGALERRRVPSIAVSPLIGGRALKGPADRMLARLGGGRTPSHVAACYEGLIDALVVDEADSAELNGLPVRAVVTRTLMSDEQSRRALATAAIEAGSMSR
jgi:LPPG:FO 2-phospho-L-lactate transferase